MSSANEVYWTRMQQMLTGRAGNVLLWVNCSTAWCQKQSFNFYFCIGIIWNSAVFERYLNSFPPSLGATRQTLNTTAYGGAIQGNVHGHFLHKWWLRAVFHNTSLFCVYAILSAVADYPPVPALAGGGYIRPTNWPSSENDGCLLKLFFFYFSWNCLLS